MRSSSALAGTNHAVSGSVGCTATAKPNVDGPASVISVQVAASSTERKMPLWCCVHNTSGSAGQRTMRCGSWVYGSSARSGGRYPARMPSHCTSQLFPASSVRHAPPHDTPASNASGRRGSMHNEWMPGRS